MDMNDPIPNQLDALRMFALGVEVADPRLSSEERCDLIDQMLAIDPVTTALILGSFAAGMVGQLTERVPESQRDSYTDFLLTGFRRNVSTAPLDFLPED